jgi:hypothetical protein
MDQITVDITWKIIVSLEELGMLGSLDWPSVHEIVKTVLKEKLQNASFRAQGDCSNAIRKIINSIK